MPKPFLEYLLENINESRKIPKAQVERAISPFLDIFIEEILSGALKHDEKYSGNIIKICPEFPLKKPGETKQSTNIDWLMCNPDKKQILLVELKTSDSSVDYSFEDKDKSGKTQFDKYDDVKEKIIAFKGAFLLNELLEIWENAKEPEKSTYGHSVGKVLKYKAEISICDSAKIIYIVPKTSKVRALQYVNEVITFSDLPDHVTGIYENEWQVIHKHLIVLDIYPEFENVEQPSKKKRPRPEPAGYVKFDELVCLCEKYQDEVIIGFMGGEKALINMPLKELNERKHYKWDYSTNIDKWENSNWLSGKRVLELIKIKFDNT